MTALTRADAVTDAGTVRKAVAGADAVLSAAAVQASRVGDATNRISYGHFTVALIDEIASPVHHRIHLAVRGNVL